MAILLIIGILFIFGAIGLAIAAFLPERSEETVSVKQSSENGYLLTVEGMHCEHCKTVVEEALNAHEGISAQADIATGVVSVHYEGCPSLELLDTLKQDIEKAGYSVSEIEHE